MSDEDKELLARIGQLAGLSSVLPASPPASLTNCYQAKSIATKANRPAPTLHRRIVQLPIIEVSVSALVPGIDINWTQTAFIGMPLRLIQLETIGRSIRALITTARYISTLR